MPYRVESVKGHHMRALSPPAHPSWARLWAYLNLFGTNLFNMFFHNNYDGLPQQVFLIFHNAAFLIFRLEFCQNICPTLCHVFCPFNSHVSLFSALLYAMFNGFGQGSSSL